MNIPNVTAKRTVNIRLEYKDQIDSLSNPQHLAEVAERNSVETVISILATLLDILIVS